MAPIFSYKCLFFCSSIISFNANAFPFVNPLATGFMKRDPTALAGPVPITSDNNGIYIRAASLNDNSLLVGYTTTEDNGTVHALKTSRSTDGGQSWQSLGEVYRGATAQHDIDNAMPIQLSSGRVLYAYRNHDRTGSTYTYYRITMSYSDDGGQTFSYLSTVDQRAASSTSKNGLWEPFLRIAKDGSVQCYYSSEDADNDQDGLMRYSQDGGATWSSPITVSGANVTSRDGMQGVAPIDDNTLLAVFEETTTGHFEVSGVVSHDDGMTWGERRKVYSPPQGQAGAPQVCNVGGTIVVSFMTTEDHAGIDGGVDGGDMKVIVSQDGATTWGSSFTTGAAPAHWPGLFTLDSSRFMALYSQDGSGALSQIYSPT